MLTKTGINKVFISILLVSTQVLGETKDNSSISSLIEMALTQSFDNSAAKAESRFQEKNKSAISLNQNLPQITASASYQQYYYDRNWTNSAGTPVSNNGQKPIYGLVVSYDLQKLFGPESDLAKQSASLAKIQEKLTARDVVRNVKKGYFAIYEIKAEIDELNKLIVLFERIDGILHKQRRMGVNTEIERKQFQIQKSILNSDLQARTSDLEAAYTQLSLSTNIDSSQLKVLIQKITKKPDLIFVNRSNLNLEKINDLQDRDMVQNLARDYNASKLEYEKYNSFVLPSVYIKASREMPTMPSSDGYQTIGEVGISIPIDSFFTRSAQKEALGAKASKNEILFQKAMLDYKNQVRLNILNLNRYKSQNESLNQTRQETKQLLDKAFLYYSQKRIDVLGTLDIFQKYLQAARNSLVNNLQIESIDAELEYLVGGGVQ